MYNYFVLSDVHGCYDKLYELVNNHWNPDDEKLVVLGDLVDRGEKSFEVVSYLMKLKSLHGDNVVVLKGNHDFDFVNWVYSEHPSYDWYDDLRVTLKSFYKSNDKLKKFKKDTRTNKAQYLRRNFRELVSFMNHLPHYHEEEHVVFVHAGVNLNLDDWRDTNPVRMLDMRSDFYHSKVKTDKKFFFGHTPTYFLGNENHNVWFSEHNDKVGIDGGAVFGGFLHGLKVSYDGEVKDVVSV